MRPGSAARCLLAAALLPGLAAGAEPVRVASINLCTDQLLLSLADREQVASVTFLALRPGSSQVVALARGHHLNHGHSEELVAVAPDVVVASAFIAPTKLRFLDDLGFRVELFDLARGIEDVYRNIERMALLLGQVDRGRTLVARMQARLAGLVPAARQPSPPRGVVYEPGGYTGGADTLRGDILRLAGWHNVADDAGIRRVGVLGLESLMMVSPDRLIVSPFAPGTHSLGQRLLLHPALRAATAGRPALSIPIREWICGGEMNLEALSRLAEARAMR